MAIITETISMRIKYLGLVFLFFSLFSQGDLEPSLPKIYADINLFEQRGLYRQAVRAYQNGDKKTYQQFKANLTTYPLFSYLVSLELNDKLSSLPYYQVDQFLSKYDGTVIGRRLLTNWLDVLAEKKHWHDFRSYYSANIRSTRLQCLFLWARLQTSDETALEEVAALWDVKKSQPETCDPLFNEWIKQGYLTQNILWSRYQKAINAKEYSLARYLNKLANNHSQPYFTALKSIHYNPEKLRKIRHLEKKNNYSKDIVEYGLLRLQRRNREQAFEYFRHFEDKSYFDENFKELFLARNKNSEIKQYSTKDLSKIPGFISTFKIRSGSIESLLLKAVREQNWKFFIRWHGKLSETEKSRDQWLYWLARALEETKIDKNQSVVVFKKLAKKRSYYGFLAADRLGQTYTLQDKPLTVDNNLLLEVNHIPAISRARELFFTQNIRDARREWRDGTQGLSALAIQASAKLANEWGWHRKAIEMLGSIQAWDHLAIRFPVIHQDFIKAKAQRFNYSPSLIFAIARQESAWQQDATSHAGARGLMQLIPSTAQDAAKKVGIKHQKSQLYLPEHNILLGSFHINELLQKYRNNRVPAIAAYNAGQHRVNQWMKKSNGKLPYDVWIETIPFSETRKYVKNVLYYSALYDYRSGNKINLLTALERNTLL